MRCDGGDGDGGGDGVDGGGGDGAEGGDDDDDDGGGGNGVDKAFPNYNHLTHTSTRSSEIKLSWYLISNIFYLIYE